MERVGYGAYGPVLVRSEGNEIRIGIYDDDQWEFDDDSDDEDGEGTRQAIVYFCEPPFLFDSQFFLVDPDRLTEVNTEALFRRRSQLAEQLVAAKNDWIESPPEIADPVDPYRLLLEYALVSRLLAERMFEARNHEGDRGGAARIRLALFKGQANGDLSFGGSR